MKGNKTFTKFTAQVGYDNGEKTTFECASNRWDLSLEEAVHLVKGLLMAMGYDSGQVEEWFKECDCQGLMIDDPPDESETLAGRGYEGEF